ncbi:MAG TPA: hypothetical protein VFX45_06910 [Solirubrobacterales bacterium]|nr:hypothetical protein [Solirubrobacterales bacterium]
MASQSKETIVVSMLPRGEAYGGSLLIALDRESLELIAVREFTADEYLEDPVLGEPGKIRHARGLATLGDKLYVALFNQVCEYTVVDPRELDLRLERTFTDPRACDLHGISVSGSSLAAASTGTDSVITWDLESEEASVTSLGIKSEEDVRFPDRLARDAEVEDWRDVLEVDRHVNGVSIRPDGTPIVCSLSEVLELGAGGVRSLHLPEEGRMHDGYLSPSETLLLTDASCGTLLSLDLNNCEDRRSTPIAKPEEWFVRGIGVVDKTAYVLSSEAIPSRQRNPMHDLSAAPEAVGGSFRVAAVNLDHFGATIDEELVRVPEAPRGAVVYGVAGL